jgi:hypothetical protein
MCREASTVTTKPTQADGIEKLLSRSGTKEMLDIPAAAM